MRIRPHSLSRAPWPACSPRLSRRAAACPRRTSTICATSSRRSSARSCRSSSSRPRASRRWPAWNLGEPADVLAAQDRGRHAGQAPGPVNQIDELRSSSKTPVPAGSALAADRRDEPGAEVLQQRAPAAPARRRRGSPGAGMPAPSRLLRPPAKIQEPQGWRRSSGALQQRLQRLSQGQLRPGAARFPKLPEQFPPDRPLRQRHLLDRRVLCRQRRFRQAVDVRPGAAAVSAQRQGPGSCSRRATPTSSWAATQPGVSQLRSVIQQYATSSEANLARQRLREARS